MEGPLVRIVAEELAIFNGKIVKLASGNARIEKEVVEVKKIEDVFSRGKNLFIRFLDLSFKIHFLMFGSYRINEEKMGTNPRLCRIGDRVSSCKAFIVGWFVRCMSENVMHSR